MGKRKMVGKLIILDMDGTLYSSEARFQECQKIANGNKRVFWNCFQSEQFMSLDKPIENVVKYAKSQINEKAIVVVVSGRSEKQRQKTIEQLERIGIRVIEIILRSEKDFRKDFEFKTAVIRELLEKYSPEKTIMIDDSDEVLKTVKERFPEIEVIDAKTLY